MTYPSNPKDLKEKTYQIAGFQIFISRKNNIRDMGCQIQGVHLIISCSFIVEKQGICSPKDLKYDSFRILFVWTC